MEIIRRKVNESERKSIKNSKWKYTVLKEKDKLSNYRKKGRTINIKLSILKEKYIEWKDKNKSNEKKRM